MNISRSLKGIAASMIIAFIGSCGGGGGATADGFTFSFDGVQEDDAVRSMELGTCSVFNISYQGQLMTISGVALKDLNEVEFTNNSGGTVEYTGTEGTYCSPAVSPGKDVYLHVTIGTNPPAVAIFTIQLPVDGSACTTSIDCQAGGDTSQFCYYGTCKTASSVGVNLSEPCVDQGDCSNSSNVCIAVMYDSCQKYCTDVDVLLGGQEVPTTQAACGLVSGTWYNPPDYGSYVCLSNDMVLCSGNSISDQEDEGYSLDLMHLSLNNTDDYVNFVGTTPVNWPINMDAVVDSPCQRAILRLSVGGGTQPAPCIDHDGAQKCIGVGVGESGGAEISIAVDSTQFSISGYSGTYMYVTGEALLDGLKIIGASDGDIIRFMYWSEFDEANDPTEKTENYMVQVNFDNIDMCDL